MDSVHSGPRYFSSEVGNECPMKFGAAKTGLFFYCVSQFLFLPIILVVSFACVSSTFFFLTLVIDIVFLFSRWPFMLRLCPRWFRFVALYFSFFAYSSISCACHMLPAGKSFAYPRLRETCSYVIRLSETCCRFGNNNFLSGA